MTLRAHDGSPRDAAASGDSRATTVIMERDAISRSLRRMAHEVLERNPSAGSLLLLGVHTRGVPLARRLGRLVAEFGGHPVPVGTLDVAAHRDDLDLRPREPVGPTDLPVRVDDAVVVLVDDVLFTGRTVRAALDALADLGRPAAVQLAVMVDRGHRELPIRADFVGKNLPTALRERVSVRLEEVDGVDGVWLERHREDRDA